MSEVGEDSRAREYLGLLKQYVDLCEEIVQSSSVQTPFHSVWNAYQKRIGSGEIPIEVTVYDDSPCAKATMKLTNGDITMPLDACESDAQWRVTASYLKRVLQNPEYYKNNPAQLDWSWLQDVT